jgi:hypothetical protein
MGINIIKTCDKCGVVVKEKEQLWTVGITANCGGTNASPSSRLNPYVTNMSMEVCRPCLESFGIHVQHKKDMPLPSEQPTLEDRIREIIELCS